eukprot:gnl/Dysnectes_brevis/1929_a2216_1136.p1 GENE.gnl/Dysnectes_brevis/1929_a2216_1136~~gnl/Dysnectes_brevis/1929_a2216_1136.p1  ORF type:complete len:530 (-),score=112.12 gnl/Dysnectes_brevis/1929_a2216_1136:187-1776(-)
MSESRRHKVAPHRPKKKPAPEFEENILHDEYLQKSFDSIVTYGGVDPSLWYEAHILEQTGERVNPHYQRTGHTSSVLSFVPRVLAAGEKKTDRAKRDGFTITYAEDNQQVKLKISSNARKAIFETLPSVRILFDRICRTKRTRTTRGGGGDSGAPQYDETAENFFWHMFLSSYYHSARLKRTRDQDNGAQDLGKLGAGATAEDAKLEKAYESIAAAIEYDQRDGREDFKQLHLLRKMDEDITTHPLSTAIDEDVLHLEEGARPLALVRGKHMAQTVEKDDLPALQDPLEGVGPQQESAPFNTTGYVNIRKCNRFSALVLSSASSVPWRPPARRRVPAAPLVLHPDGQVTRSGDAAPVSQKGGHDDQMQCRQRMMLDTLAPKSSAVWTSLEVTGEESSANAHFWSASSVRTGLPDVRDMDPACLKTVRDLLQRSGDLTRVMYRLMHGQSEELRALRQHGNPMFGEQLGLVLGLMDELMDHFQTMDNDHTLDLKSQSALSPIKELLDAARHRGRAWQSELQATMLKDETMV